MAPSKNPQNGRFQVIGVLTTEKRKKAEKRKDNQTRRLLINKQIFDFFIHVFFLPGSDGDWLPVSCSSRPLCEIVNRLFKPHFLLGHEERSRTLRLVFAGGDPTSLKPVSEFPRFVTQDPTVCVRTPSRVRVFLGRRLLLMENYSSEIEAVRRWAKDNFDRGFLKTQSSDEAFTICLEVIKSYVMVDGKRAYKGYPQIPPARLSNNGSTNPTSSGDDGSSREVNQPETGTQQPDEINGNHNESVEEPEVPGQERERTAGEQENSDVTQRQNDPFFKSVSAAFQVSEDEDAFCILSLLFDERIKNRLEMAAGAFLNMDRKQDGKMDSVTKDVLLYAHWETFGIKDREEHDNRLEGLRTVLRVATETRRAQGLKPYSEMRDAYL